MPFIKCTTAVQKAIGLSKQHVADGTESSDAPLGDWYVNRFMWGQRAVFVFMSETTLMSFVMVEGKERFTKENLPLVLNAGIARLLSFYEVERKTIEKLREGSRSCRYSKCSNRSDLRALTDLMDRYKHGIGLDGGLRNCDLTDIILNINEMPHRRLNWASAWSLVEKKLALL